jgi:hypothetical protein
MRCMKCGKKITNSSGSGKDKTYDCECGISYGMRRGRMTKLN